MEHGSRVRSEKRSCFYRQCFGVKCHCSEARICEISIAWSIEARHLEINVSVYIGDAIISLVCVPTIFLHVLRKVRTGKVN